MDKKMIEKKLRKLSTKDLQKKVDNKRFTWEELKIANSILDSRKGKVVPKAVTIPVKSSTKASLKDYPKGASISFRPARNSKHRNRKEISGKIVRSWEHGDTIWLRVKLDIGGLCFKKVDSDLKML